MLDSINTESKLLRNNWPWLTKWPNQKKSWTSAKPW